MKIRYWGILLIFIASVSFIAGYWINRNSSHKPAETRRILHYVDPMNPAYKSDKPGIAPCGMPLEPVYADQNAAATGEAAILASMPPGAFRVSAERQQLIGVKSMTVEKAPWTHTLRVLGRVSADETRTFRVNAAVSGWIVAASPFTTGSTVQKDTVLATFSFYSTEFRTALQAYVNMLSAANLSDQKEVASPNIQTERAQRVREYENIRVTGRGTTSWPLTDAYKQNLLSYGITEFQLEEIGRTRKFPEVIEIRAPISGFILTRNVSPGLRFDRGAEFFRIADLSKVWILADVFENESSFFKPGMQVKVELPYQKKALYARMSHVLPQFDPSTRTLKIRLEAENPGYSMRPDMLVNVNIPSSGPPAIIVPVEAVLDSGLNKTVFVDRGSGFFEPRQVETGRSLGERVEITRGVMPGEKIVVSGNFLIDSEARMQKVAAGITGKIARDPVCGMNVDEDRARTAGNYLEYRGQTYFFCETVEREEFRKDPERYLKTPLAQKRMNTAKPVDVVSKKRASHDGMTTHKLRDVKKTIQHGSGAMPMSGQVTHEPISGPQGMAPQMKSMEMQKAGTAPGPAMPEPENAKWHPAAPVPEAKEQGSFSPGAPSTNFKSSPDMFKPVPGAAPSPTVQSAPGSQGGTIATDPTYQKRIRSFGRPLRMRGAPPDITTTPGSQDSPAAPYPNAGQIITPGGGAIPAGQMKKETSTGEKAHD